MSNWDDDLVRRTAVTALLNDLRFCLVNIPGDVELKFKRIIAKKNGTNDPDDSIFISRHLHSVLLMARSNKFRECYKEKRNHVNAESEVDFLYDVGTNQYTIDIKREIPANVVHEFGK